MKHERVETGRSPDYQDCRYGQSRLAFRGPMVVPDDRTITFIGGAETFGRYMEVPFPTLVSRKMNRPVVNLGFPNAGPDLLGSDPDLIEICNRSAAVVFQVPDALNLSNRLYRVHRRRNDRFIGASGQLRDLFEDVDFSQFTFTRHMLGAVWEAAPDQFDVLRTEMQTAWRHRMRVLLSRFTVPVILLWLSDKPPRPPHWGDEGNPLATRPILVSGEMLKAAGEHASRTIVVVPNAHDIEEGQTDLILPPDTTDLASGALGTLAHDQAARAVIDTLGKLGIGKKMSLPEGRLIPRKTAV
ncbi:DUF6473 family protein [Aestuariibius insulae]|uniref:DUF6473 family protein n=1 Tax=Aestuariibius insulae TaxID=2058287 RepID=UPI00345E8AA1